MVKLGPLPCTSILFFPQSFLWTFLECWHHRLLVQASLWVFFQRIVKLCFWRLLLFMWWYFKFVHKICLRFEGQKSWWWASGLLNHHSCLRLRCMCSLWEFNRTYRIDSWIFPRRKTGEDKNSRHHHLKQKNRCQLWCKPQCWQCSSNEFAWLP